VEHHLSVKETIANVEALITQYEQSQEPAKRCLAAIYRKQLDQVTTVCCTAAISKTDDLKQKHQEIEDLSKSFRRGGALRKSQSVLVGSTRMPNRSGQFQEPFLTNALIPILEEAKRQLIKLTEEVVGEFKAIGDTYYANYHFDKALEAYKESLSYVEKNDLPTLWADMQWQIGMANQEIGIRTKDTAIQKHLAEAVNSYRAAQTIYTKTLLSKIAYDVGSSKGVGCW
jgi:tetratricopeptide (TPR) repeat protein